MSARKYRHEDGGGRKRSARTREPMALEAAIAWLIEQLGVDGYEAMMPRGTEVEWYSPITAEEAASERRYAEDQAARTEKWERETFARLLTKYGWVEQ